MAPLAPIQTRRHSGGPRPPCSARSPRERRSELLRELADPCTLAQLELHYQPIRWTATGEVVGAEALLRWKRGGRLLRAAEFIDVAGSAGRLPTLEWWSMEHALREARVWGDAGWNGWMSINLSGPSLLEPGFIPRLAALMETTGAAPEAILFEVTESMDLAGNRTVRGVLAGLHDLGVRVAIDDFGTGYSNFSYLRDFEPDLIKLDRTFVASDGEPGPVEEAGNGRAGISSPRLLTALVDFAHRLGKQVVVEGVEGGDEWKRAVACGCELVQGYLLGRPIPGPHFVREHIVPPVAPGKGWRETLAGGSAVAPALVGAA